MSTEFLDRVDKIRFLPTPVVGQVNLLTTLHEAGRLFPVEVGKLYLSSEIPAVARFEKEQASFPK